MKRSGLDKRKFVVIISFIILFLAVLGVVGNTKSFGIVPLNNLPQLIFLNTDNNEELINIEMEPNQEVSIGYTHSLYKTKQWEFYRMNENHELVLDRLEFESADAADYYEHHVELADREAGSFANWVIKKNQILEEVHFRIPYLHPMIVGYEEDQYNLNELGNSGDQVILKIVEGG